MQICNNPIQIKSEKVNFKAIIPDNRDFFDALNACQDEKTALLLIRKQNDLVSPKDKNGDHIIHFIVKRDYFETLKYITQNPEKTKNLIELRGEDGKSPLAVARSLKIAKLLIAKGANLYSLDNNLEPAGINSVLPREVIERVKKATEKLKSLEQPPISHPVLQESNVNTTTLRQSAAEAEYSKVDSTSKIAAETEIRTESQRKISFFSMFQPKQKENAVPEQTKEQPPEVKEKQQAEQKNTSVDKTVSRDIQEGKTPSAKSIEKKEIKIKGTDAYTRIDSSEIPNLDYLVGIETIKSALRKSIVEPIINEKVGEYLSKNTTTIPNGILLSAPPGNGKSTVVKALGAEASMPVFEVSNTNELEALIKIISKNFPETKQRAIVYMRGLDNLYAENNASGELTNALSRIMNQTAKKGALLVFSTECYENIPKVILTPGKIDKILSFKAPDTSVRLEYINSYSKGKDILSEIDKKQIADKTQGFSIAQIKHIIDDAVLFGSAESVEKLTTEYLLDRIKIFSKEQDIPVIDEYNKTSMYDTTLRRYQPDVFDAENFEGVAGMPVTKSSVEESILKPWKNADKLRRAKIQLPAGGVFAGDPGTSKTYMAKAIARSLNLPLYVMKMSEVGSSYVHETSRRMARIVDQLITKFDETGEASILLMDEIDHFQKGQSQHGAEEVNTLLQEIERGRNKILFIGTTNELECLPDSLTRDGRMGTVIHFEHCDAKAAEAIIKNMLKGRKDNSEVVKLLENSDFLDNVAKRCSGMVASSVSAIVNDALADTVMNNVKLEVAFDTAVKSRKKKDIEKMLSQNSKSAGHRLNITEDSTIMYDTKHPRMVMADSDPKQLDDLGGMDEVKTILRDEIIDIYQPDTLQLLKENKLPITKGFILHGPSGNGKTTIIKALANEMRLPVYSLNTGNIGSSYIHQLAKNAQEVREQLAYKYKMTGERSILFMDEAQQLVPRTSGAFGAHSHNIEETNFFKDMIMTAEQDGIIYAMATNDLSQVEPAFYENSDRLGVCVYVGNPSILSRIGIIGKLISDRPIASALNNPIAIQKLAEIFEGFSISKISQSILNLVRDSIKTKTPITLDHSIEVIKKTGLIK